MLFGNHWALIGILLAFCFVLFGVVSAMRGGRGRNGERRSGSRVWIAMIIASSLAYPAFCMVAPRTAARASSRVARQFNRAVHAATAHPWRDYARSEEGPISASGANLERPAPVEGRTLRYCYTRAPWLANAGLTRRGLVWNSLLGLAIAALLYVGYAFLDAATRGHFTWRLRVVSIIAFVSLCAALAVLRFQGVANL